MTSKDSDHTTREKVRRRPRILFLTDKLPSTTAGGASAYAHDIVASLGDIGVVECLVLRGMASRMAWNAVSPASDEVREIHPRFFRIGEHLFSWRNALRRLLRGRPRLKDFPRRPEDRSICHELDHCYSRELAKRRHYDIVVSNYFWKADLLGHFHKACRVILAHDVFHDHVDAHRIERWEGGRPITPEVEMSALNKADVVIAISDHDASRFKEIGVSSVIVQAPMSARVPQRKLAQTQGNRMIFVGSHYRPNVEGIEWFCARVFPLIRRDMPDAIVEVVGSVCGGVTRLAGHGVELSGFVEDLGEAYARASMVVIPILSGTGMKIKLVEAVDYGLPFVTTLAGMLGLQAQLKKHGFEPFDEPQAFAAECIRCMRDLDFRRQRVAAVAELKRNYFAPDVAHRAMKETLCQSMESAGSGVA